MGSKLFYPGNVLDAARERIEWVFDTFGLVAVSVSGGKDSTVLFELAYAEAERRQQTITVFFLDQESEYQGSVDTVRGIMARPWVRACWYQVPLRMTNATSYRAEFFHAWQPEQAWMRAKEATAMTQAPGAPDRFYPFMEWFERQMGEDACLMIGLRGDEALNRYRAVSKHPAVPGKSWTSKGQGGSVLAYPLYDWHVSDIWRFIGREQVAYNPVYDKLYWLGVPEKEQRVSFLLHEHSFQSLTYLRAIEPDILPVN